MKKFLFAVLILVATFALVGCGGSGSDTALLSNRNVNDVLDDFRASEKELGYEIHDVKYGENNGEHFCSAVFDKNNRGSVYFTVTEKGEIISAKILMTDATDYNLGYQGGFLLTRILFASGFTQDEIQHFLQDQSNYVNAEIAKQQNSITPAIDKEFFISSGRLKKKVSVHVKADEKELSYTAAVAK